MNGILGAMCAAALNATAYMPPPYYGPPHPPAQAYAYAPPLADVGQVKFIQQAMNFLQHANLVVDGVWGPSTTQAVFIWQQAHGLPQSGLFDFQTLASITSAIGMHEPLPAPQQ